MPHQNIDFAHLGHIPLLRHKYRILTGYMVFTTNWTLLGRGDITRDLIQLVLQKSEWAGKIKYKHESIILSLNQRSLRSIHLYSINLQCSVIGEEYCLTSSLKKNYHLLGSPIYKNSKNNKSFETSQRQMPVKKDNIKCKH